MGICYQEKIYQVKTERINYSMSLFEFKNYGMPTGEVFIPTNEYAQGHELPTTFEGHNIDQYIGDRKVILIGIPGAFTPGCTEKHLPGFVQEERNLYRKGIQEIICLSVNDPFVMIAFDDYINADGSEITMAADPYGEVAEQLGLIKDNEHLGKRCKRFAAVVENQKITTMFVDEKGIDKSSAENILQSL